jgi:hypothetical protein
MWSESQATAAVPPSKKLLVPIGWEAGWVPEPFANKTKYTRISYSIFGDESYEIQMYACALRISRSFCANNKETNKNRNKLRRFSPQANYTSQTWGSLVNFMRPLYWSCSNYRMWTAWVLNNLFYFYFNTFLSWAKNVNTLCVIRSCYIVAWSRLGKRVSSPALCVW